MKIVNAIAIMAIICWESYALFMLHIDGVNLTVCSSLITFLVGLSVDSKSVVKFFEHLSHRRKNE